MLAYDLSVPHPHPHDLTEAGYQAVLRWLTPDLLPSEILTLHAAGLGVGLVWDGGHAALLGGLAGAQHGLAAADAARALGYPVGHVIWVPVIEAPYFEAFRAALHGYNYLAGGYAVRPVIDDLAPTMPGALWWQQHLAESELSPHASLYQQDGPAVQVFKQVPFWGLASVPQPAT